MNINSEKIYDLDKGTFIFVKNAIDYVEKLLKKMTNIEIGRQLIKSADSVGANYIEANEALSKKDFLVRIKICKKKEMIHCLIEILGICNW